MSKVTITIDDSNAAITAAFGANSLDSIADQFGYMEMVEKDENELPAKVKVEKELNGETFTVEVYPEGTEMFKVNPHSRTEFVAQVMLERHIVPALINNLHKDKQAQALAAIETEMKTAATVLESAAEITVN